MDKELIEILNKKKLYNIQLCIEYLWLAGYPIDDSYFYSLELFNPIIQIDTSNISDEKELFLLDSINGCEIIISNTYSNTIIYSKYDKNNKILCYQDLKTGVFWVDYDNIWLVLETKYSMNYFDIEGFIINQMEKHFKLICLTAHRGSLLKRR